jgi:hypothetical protein
MGKKFKIYIHYGDKQRQQTHGHITENEDGFLQ